MGLLILFVSILFLLQAPPEVFAQEALPAGEAGWVINNFHSDVSIQQDGKVFVSEVIESNFGGLQKHGIFRKIPYKYRLQNGESRYTKVEIADVTNNSMSTPYDSYTSGDFVEVKIGDPDKPVSGKQTYRINYFVTGVLNTFEDHDEFYWNVTGSSWPVAINQAGAAVTFPSEAITQIACFEGATGSNNPCLSNQVSKTQATFQSSKSLSLGEGLTIVVGYTKGLAQIINVPPPKSPIDDLFTTINLLAFLLALILSIGVSIWLLWEKRRGVFWGGRVFFY